MPVPSGGTGISPGIHHHETVVFHAIEQLADVHVGVALRAALESIHGDPPLAAPQLASLGDGRGPVAGALAAVIPARSCGLTPWNRGSASQRLGLVDWRP